MPGDTPRFLALNIAFCTAIAASPCAAQSDGAAMADLSGLWQFEAHAITNEKPWAINPLCFFQQVGEHVTGTCQGTNGVGTASGNVDGNELRFTWKEIAETTADVTASTQFSGALDSKITMKGSLPGGTFTGKRLWP